MKRLGLFPQALEVFPLLLERLGTLSGRVRFGRAPVGIAPGGGELALRRCQGVGVTGGGRTFLNQLTGELLLDSADLDHFRARADGDLMLGLFERFAKLRIRPALYVAIFSSSRLRRCPALTVCSACSATCDCSSSRRSATTCVFAFASASRTIRLVVAAASSVATRARSSTRVSSDPV